MRGIANCSVWGALIIGTVGSARLAVQGTALGLSWWVLVGTVGTVGLNIEVVTMGLYTIIHRGVGSVGLYVVDSVGRHTNHTSPLLALPRPMCSD